MICYYLLLKQAKSATPPLVVLAICRLDSGKYE